LQHEKLGGLEDGLFMKNWGIRVHIKEAFDESLLL